jgi:hypothetical protein
LLCGCKSKKATTVKETFIFFMPETKFHNLFQVRKGGNSIWPQNVAVLYQNAAKFDRRHPSLVRQGSDKNLLPLRPFSNEVLRKT